MVPAFRLAVTVKAAGPRCSEHRAIPRGRRVTAKVLLSRTMRRLAGLLLEPTGLQERQPHRDNRTGDEAGAPLLDGRRFCLPRKARQPVIGPWARPYAKAGPAGSLARGLSDSGHRR